MTPDRCGFGKPLDQLPEVVQDFAAWLAGRLALAADERTFVPFTDPRAALRVCGCRWTRNGTGVKFTARCEAHAVTCRSSEDWEHDVLVAQ